MSTTRTAVVTMHGSDTVERIARYLPDNYAVVAVDGNEVTVAGRDVAGWTLDGYVIPRLRSGMIAAREVDNREARAQRASDALFGSAKMTHEDGTLYGDHPQP